MHEALPFEIRQLTGRWKFSVNNSCYRDHCIVKDYHRPSQILGGYRKNSIRFTRIIVQIQFFIKLPIPELIDKFNFFLEKNRFF